MKVAVQVRFSFIVTVEPQPVPLQPEKEEPVAGVAVRITDELYVYDSEQSVPQEMPAGFEVTVPAPFPAVLTESVYEQLLLGGGDGAVPAQVPLQLYVPVLAVVV